jgi:hypothetical protein
LHGRPTVIAVDNLLLFVPCILCTTTTIWSKYMAGDEAPPLNGIRHHHDFRSRDTLTKSSFLDFRSILAAVQRAVPSFLSSSLILTPTTMPKASKPTKTRKTTAGAASGSSSGSGSGSRKRAAAPVDDGMAMAQMPLGKQLAHTGGYCS